MAISTETLNKVNKEALLHRLNIDDFEVDYFGSVHPKENETLYESSWQIFGKTHQSEKVVKPPIIRWLKSGVWYSAVIPVEVETVRWNYLFARGVYDIIDWDAMEKSAEQIIRGA